MSYFIWLIVGIILLIIIIWVTKHTEVRKGYHNYKPVKMPIWVYLLGVVIAAIPLLNLGAFVVVAIPYLVGVVDSDVRFTCNAKWFKFLTKEI